MRKLQLTLENLTVESFHTGPASAIRGTVAARQDQYTQALDCTANSCGFTENYATCSCEMNTARATTCNETGGICCEREVTNGTGPICCP